MLSAADGLMDGDLSRAEQVCAARPESERRECVDAFLAQRMGEIGTEMDRSLEGLDLLERAGEKRCAGTPGSDRHNECVLAEMERMVTELAPACANKSGEAQHRCIIDEVFRQLGP